VRLRGAERFPNAASEFRKELETKSPDGKFEIYLCLMISRAREAKGPSRAAEDTCEYAIKQIPKDSKNRAKLEAQAYATLATEYEKANAKVKALEYYKKAEAAMKRAGLKDYADVTLVEPDGVASGSCNVPERINWTQTLMRLEKILEPKKIDVKKTAEAFLAERKST